MHKYYAENREKLKKDMHKMLSLIAPELEEVSQKSYRQVFAEIWNYYQAELLERFPYIGGKSVSGTHNLTGAYCFVAMGEVLKKYGCTVEKSGYLMMLSYERMALKIPRIARWLIRRLSGNTKLLTRLFVKRDAKNRANAAKNAGSFETKTQIPPEAAMRLVFIIWSARWQTLLGTMAMRNICPIFAIWIMWPAALWAYRCSGSIPALRMGITAISN